MKKETALSLLDEDAYIKAPFIIHHKLCSEFARIHMLTPNISYEEIPEAMEIINAINVIRKLYPQIKVSTKNL